MNEHELLFYWHIFFSVIIFIFGACIGSYLNVCIYRIPREESTVKPRSHCPHCKKQIAWWNNIPLVSYIVLRARCTECGGKIIPRYFLVELLVAVLFLLAWLKYDFLGAPASLGLVQIYDFELVPICWLIISGLVLGTFVDFEHLIIPDRVTIGGCIAGLMLSITFPSLHGEESMIASVASSAIGLVVGWGGLWLVAILGRWAFKKEAMGFGDVKLLGAIGAFFGWQGVLFTLIVSSFLGSIAGILMVVTKNKEMQSRIPYGPYIALAAILWMYWGSAWWGAYVDLMTPEPVYPYVQPFM